MDTPGVQGRPRRSLRLLAVGTAVLLVVALIGVAIRVAGEPQAAAVTQPLARSAIAPSIGARQLVPLSDLAASPMLPPASDVLMLGDSLALSTYAWFADLVPDRHVSWEAQVGRTTTEARRALETLAAAGRVPPILVVSSGTNDVSAPTLRQEAERILAVAGPDRCVVWADVVRPDGFGDGMAAANAALEAAWADHPNVIPVRWTRMVDKHPEWLTSDGVHPVEAGNIARARAFADAVLRCSPLDPDAPVAAQEHLPQASFLAPGGGSVPGVGSGTWYGSPAVRSGPSAKASTAPTRSPSTVAGPPASAPPSSDPPPASPSAPAGAPSASGTPAPSDGGAAP